MIIFFEILKVQLKNLLIAEIINCMALSDLIFHTNVYISTIIQNYGIFAYFILFIVVFAETGFVLAPFLPGDSLIFISGVFASAKVLNLFLLFILFSAAAVGGDSLNYAIGYFFGERVFSKFIKRKNIERTKKFFERHGKRTIVFARFVPIVRTFAPFVAGVGKMRYKEFFSYNIVGGLAWVSLFLFSGYFFGSVPFVKNNLSLVVVLIIIASLIPVVIEYLRERRK